MGTRFGRRAADGTFEYHDSKESLVAAKRRESSDARSGFFGLIGLRVFLFTLVEVVILWSIKFLGETVAPGWLLSYLVRDLVTYHGSGSVVGDASSDPGSDETAQISACESNVVAIDSARQLELTGKVCSRLGAVPALRA